MKIGLFAPAGNPFATPDYLNLVGEAAEERGFDSIWVAEHVVLFDDYASKYPYSADGKIPKGTRVRVRGIDGLVLRVEPEDDPG